MQLYGSAYARPSGDIDILVSRKDVVRAVRILSGLGYAPPGDTPVATVLSRKHELAMTRRDTGTVIDLHWELLPPTRHFRFDVAAAIRHSEAVDFYGAAIHTLGEDDLLLYLCLHAAKHCWEDIKWIEDIGQLMRLRPSLDWEGLLERARQGRCLRRVTITAILVSKLCNQNLPERLKQAIASDPRARAVAYEVANALASGAQLSTPRATMIELTSLECWSDRLTRWFRVMRTRIHVTDADRNSIRLPACCAFAYLLVRPVRLFRTYGAGNALRLLALVFPTYK